MSQPSIASYFHSRKRAAVDEIFNAKNKVILLDQKCDNLATSSSVTAKNKIFDGDLAASGTDTSNNSPTVKFVNNKQKGVAKLLFDDVLPTASDQSAKLNKKSSPFSKPVEINSTNKYNENNSTVVVLPEDKAAAAEKQQKIVKFTLGGCLSPKKRITHRTIATASEKFLNETKNIATNPPNLGLKTPTKEEQAKYTAQQERLKKLQNLPIDVIKKRLTRSSKLDELKASMSRIQQFDEKRQKTIAARNQKADKHSFTDQQSDRAAKILGKSLKEFRTIDLEVLTSPEKGQVTPVKLHPPKISTGGENELMSPKKTATPRRLFSPIKSSPVKVSAAAAASPTKSLYAFERFQNLVTESAGATTTHTSSQLQLPYKYRCLEEVFKCLDIVCAMFANRQETITMKKLKPAVQRMLRRNFTETNLAQIRHLYKDAYKFQQKKMLNAGSHTKYDYYQLVIIPNVQSNGGGPKSETVTKLTEDNIIQSGQNKTMNPQVMIERQQKFHQLLLDKVKDEHDKFLKNLDPPMHIPREKLIRWHAEFDLQSCPDIPRDELPLPPNIEKFSSAKDILATARDLFKCSTPMERIMQYEEKHQEQQQQLRQMQAQKRVPFPIGEKSVDQFTPEREELETPTASEQLSKILEKVPKSLLERVRARQAAKAMYAMTRRPSQDAEAEKYGRLPELARYLRNIFVTESKGTLELDTVLAKLENSFRERMSKDVLKELLRLIEIEAPNNWLTFHFIRKTDFIKIKRDLDLNHVIQTLERKANEKK